MKELPPVGHITPCPVIRADGGECTQVGHVVLFAPEHGYEFAGRTWRRGQRIVACLSHGGQVYAAKRPGFGGQVAPWLTPYLGQLPAIHLPEHLDNAPAATVRHRRPPAYRR